ncbi:hypothetical protein GCM10022402_22310 [Salinactinospora qingdaonensis]|uniref:Uncharacterized protein n=1 Tax=Salinactinospora qingdaonensis TaxID=702744 RepID=A0ABP7FKC0_9ACTN
MGEIASLGAEEPPSFAEKQVADMPISEDLQIFVTWTGDELGEPRAGM